MIVLDTDVISALMRPQLNASVYRWLGRQQVETLRITVVSVHEIVRGIALIADGKRKRALEKAFDAIVQSPLGVSVLGVDVAAARSSAICRVSAERAVGHCDVPDALIAGIALSNAAALATRNMPHFKHFGVPVVDPWA